MNWFAYIQSISYLFAVLQLSQWKNSKILRDGIQSKLLIIYVIKNKIILNKSTITLDKDFYVVQLRCLCLMSMGIYVFQLIYEKSKDIQNSFAQTLTLKPKPLILLHPYPSLLLILWKTFFSLSPTNQRGSCFFTLKKTYSKRKPRDRKNPIPLTTRDL